jgi:hypothetical protein
LSSTRKSALVCYHKGIESGRISGTSPFIRGMVFSMALHVRITQKGSAPMKSSLYGEPDYAFGQMMLTLRTSLGLTQAHLSEYLGISRQAVGDWEAGRSYPNTHHLKAFITMPCSSRSFPPDKRTGRSGRYGKLRIRRCCLMSRGSQHY